MNTIFVKSTSGTVYAWGPTAQIRGEEPVERLANLRFGSDRWEELEEFDDPCGTISSIAFKHQIARRSFASRCGDIVVTEPHDREIEPVIRFLIWLTRRSSDHADQIERLKHEVPNGRMIHADARSRALGHLLGMMRSAYNESLRAKELLADALRIKIGRNTAIRGIANWHAYTGYRVDHGELKRSFPEAYEATVEERVSRRLVLDQTG